MSNIEGLVVTVMGLGVNMHPSPTTPIFTSYFLVVCTYDIVDQKRSEDAASVEEMAQM